MASLSTDAAQVASRAAAQLHAAADELLELGDAHREAGRTVLAASRPPRRSGAMAAGQVVTAAPGGITIASTVRYWTFVHWGAPRAGVRARPWIAEALTRTTDEVVEVYAAHARAALSNVKG